MPSVRGRERVVVGLLLVAAATVSGAFVGLVSGLLFAPVRSAIDVGSSPIPVVAVIVAIGLTLDVANLVTGRVMPPASGRQVPQEWTRLFDPRIVSVLFGARLGVGPLTILSTWCWWAVTLASALSGLALAVMVGATFGFVRLVVTVGVSLAVEGRDQAEWFGKLRSRQRPGWLTMNGLALLLLMSAAAVGCSTAASAAAPDPTETPSSQPPLTTPAQLEDFVREPTPPQNPEPNPEGHIDLADQVADELSIVGNQEAEEEQMAAIDLDEDSDDVPGGKPEALATALITEIGGFQPVEDEGADRFLDLHAAAKIQPDPTEEVALLETRGFRGGWTRAFRNEANDVAVTSVYEFEDATQAEFYLEDGLITIGGYGGSFFDIEGQPGVRGFAQSFTEGEEELISLGAAFQVGPRWFLTYIVGSPESVTPAMLLPVVDEQRQSELVAGG